MLDGRKRRENSGDSDGGAHRVHSAKKVRATSKQNYVLAKILEMLLVIKEGLRAMIKITLQVDGRTRVRRFEEWMDVMSENIGHLGNIVTSDEFRPHEQSCGCVVGVYKFMVKCRADPNTDRSGEADAMLTALKKSRAAKRIPEEPEKKPKDTLQIVPFVPKPQPQVVPPVVPPPVVPPPVVAPHVGPHRCSNSAATREKRAQLLSKISCMMQLLRVQLFVHCHIVFIFDTEDDPAYWDVAMRSYVHTMDCFIRSNAFQRELGREDPDDPFITYAPGDSTVLLRVFDVLVFIRRCQTHPHVDFNELADALLALMREQYRKGNGRPMIIAPPTDAAWAAIDRLVDLAHLHLSAGERPPAAARPSPALDSQSLSPPGSGQSLPVPASPFSFRSRISHRCQPWSVIPEWNTSFAQGIF